MRTWVAATVVMVVAGSIVWGFWRDTTAGQGIALSLVGVASVIAVSLVFFAVGRSEDAEREAAAAPRRAPDEPGPGTAGEPHPRPALDRRRPKPPRRPS